MFGLRKTTSETGMQTKPLELHLVRHAEAGQDMGIDSHGPALTARGNAQARRVGKRLSKVRYAAIYSSDLTRARQTADAIAKHHPDDLMTLTRDLREVTCAHTAQGMSRTIDRNEDRSMLEEHDAIQRVILHLRQTHTAGECVLLVSHGNIMRSLIPMLSNINPASSPLFEINNTSLSIIDLWPSGRAVVRLANCISHLPKRMIT